MSLLQNEDFAIYQLRTSYLAHIRDGVGERLIDINTAFLNDPAFRAAGWAADPAQLKRTYSPPIPAAVTSDYFQAPPQPAGASGFPEDDDEEGGIVTGGGGNDTIGIIGAGRRRRRKELQDEDDSSELSDESEDEIPSASRPANKVSFAKMPGRTRADSSPIRSTRQQEGPSLVITTPSQRGGSPRLRRGSLGAVEAMKARKRRDTATSSEVSSENDFDSPTKRGPVTKNSRLAPNPAEEDDEDNAKEDSGQAVEDDMSDSDDGSLASDFSETIGSGSLLERTTGRMESSSLGYMRVGRPRTPIQTSPKKSRTMEPGLQDLPPPRPISIIQPVSALAMAIKAKSTKPANPVDRFATLSGKGDPRPLHIKIFLPAVEEDQSPMEFTLRRFTNDGIPVIVAEAIGFTLWMYGEEGIKPSISGEKLNVNYWTLRIVEDDEVDYDFPALGRTRPITDFTSNNNRPSRGRSRDKVWDEFALVEATPEQLKENERETPIYSEQAAKARADAEAAAANDADAEDENDVAPLQQPPQLSQPHTNPITDPRLITAAFRKDSSHALDRPAAPVSHATPRSGAAKKLRVHCTDNNMNPHTEIVDATTDTYFAEVFDQVCKRLNVDKALYFLKVKNTTTVAPSDRTVESLGQDRSSLDLVRRRFVGDGDYGLTGSPSSTSPNAPLLLTSTTQTTTKRSARKAAAGGGATSVHPLAQQADNANAMSSLGPDKRYNVLRKQPMSFTPSHPRVLALENEYLHILPTDIAPVNRDGGGRLQLDVGGKTTSVHFSNVVGCKINRKHPKTFRVIVFREKETKRYDFEAVSADEAAEIVSQIKMRTEPFADLLR